MRKVTERPKGQVDLAARQIQVGHQPGPRRYGCKNAETREMLSERNDMRRGYIDVDNVGLRRLDTQAQGAQALRQVSSIVVILGEAHHMML